MNGAQASVASTSPQATRAVGQRIGGALAPGDCVALTGALGAGKTHLVKAIAEGAGVSPDITVNSPTFVLVNEYVGRVYLYHVDAYRLTEPSELDSIGLDEMLERQAVVLIEWADKVQDHLPDDCLGVHLEHVGPTERTIALTASGPRSAQLLARLALPG